MKKILPQGLAALCLLVFSNFALAQDAVPPVTAHNAVFVEVGGNGGALSLNYDRLFFQRGLFKTSFRVGASYWPVRIKSDGTWYHTGTLPLELNALWGRHRHHLETGFGFTPYFQSRSSIYDRYPEMTYYPFTSYFFTRLGYRHQRPEGGIFFRAALQPSMSHTPARGSRYFTWLYGGISIGKSF